MGLGPQEAGQEQLVVPLPRTTAWGSTRKQATFFSAFRRLRSSRATLHRIAVRIVAETLLMVALEVAHDNPFGEGIQYRNQDAGIVLASGENARAKPRPAAPASTHSSKRR